MKTVAFLQNMWVYPRSVATVTKHAPTSDERERFITYALFAGCLTGRRLLHAFGDLCNSIIWQEANPTVADNPKDYHAPDTAHIRAVLDKHHPDAILCLSARGMMEIYETCQAWSAANNHPIRFVSAPHPAARGANVPNDLCEAARRLAHEEAL